MGVGTDACIHVLRGARTGFCLFFSLGNLCGRTGRLASPGQIMKERSRLDSVRADCAAEAHVVRCGRCRAEFLVKSRRRCRGERAKFSGLHAVGKVERSLDAHHFFSSKELQTRTCENIRRWGESERAKERDSTTPEPCQLNEQSDYLYLHTHVSTGAQTPSRYQRICDTR